MTQKWNLQDIRPTEPRPQRRPSVPPTIIRNDEEETHHVAVNNHQPSRPAPRSDMRGPRSDMRGDMRPAGGTVSMRRREPVDNEPTDETDIGLATPDYSDDSRIPIYDGKKRSRKHIVIAVGIFLAITSVGIFISHLTGGATVTVKPKERTLNVNAEFTAYKEQRPEELAYEIMTLEAVSERQVEASGQEEVKVQATGEIEITKTTPGAERLIKNTRFATLDGLIFRIEESVVVPGAVTGSDGKSVPGTIRAKVFADEAGDKYNVKPNTEFRIPGFKEGGYDDLYNAISAKNVSGFDNGFSGPKFIINDQELATARQSLQAELRDTLLARIDKEKPANMTTFPGSVAIVYNQLPPVQYGDTLVTIREQAILQMPIFKSADFAKFIAQETIVGYDREGVRIANLSDLTFAYSSATTSQSNIADMESLTFKLTGEPQIVWTYDEGKLKLDLAGKQKTALAQIMTSYKGIEKSEVKIRPIWKRSMPEDHTDITIVEQLSTTESN